MADSFDRALRVVESCLQTQIVWSCIPQRQQRGFIIKAYKRVGEQYYHCTRMVSMLQLIHMTMTPQEMIGWTMKEMEADFEQQEKYYVENS